MARILKATVADITQLVWMARKSHSIGPYSIHQFRPEYAHAELLAALKDTRRLVLVVFDQHPIGFVYCRHMRTRFVRESTVELCDAWLENNISPHSAVVVKLWFTVLAWAEQRGAEQVTWNWDLSQLPASINSTLHRLGVVQQQYYPCFYTANKLSIISD